MSEIRMSLPCNACGERIDWVGPLRHGRDPFVCDPCEVWLLEAQFRGTEGEQ